MIFLAGAVVTREEMTGNDKQFSVLHIEAENAVLVLLSEGEDRLGTLAASVPSTIEMRSQSVFSSILLGDRNVTTARMLAERWESKKGKIIQPYPGVYQGLTGFQETCQVSRKQGTMNLNKQIRSRLNKPR